MPITITHRVPRVYLRTGRRTQTVTYTLGSDLRSPAVTGATFTQVASILSPMRGT